MKLPKVLILGQPFNDFTGGGITLSNLFSCWGREELAVACVPHLLKNVSYKLCNNYYQLGKKEHRWIFPFNHIQREFSSGTIHFEAEKVDNKSISKNKYRKLLVDQLFYPQLKQAGLFHFMSKIKPSKELIQWVDDFKPDILYVQVSTRKDFYFTEVLYEYLIISMVIHIMDDWPSTISNKGILKKYWFRKIDREFRSLLNKATLLMTISDQMTEAYEQRYQNKFIAFHNTVDIGLWKKFRKNNFKLDKHPVFLYAGRIGIGIDHSLKSIAKAIQIVNEELKLEIRFVLQTKETFRWYKDFNCVQHKTFEPYSDVPKSISKADFLILPYDFSEESRQYIKYSMPTKVPEYMISGVPIFIFAPENTALVRFARNLDIAIIVTENDLRCLCNAIKDLILNEYKRNAISQNARKVAEKNFDSQKIQLEFTNSMKKIWLN